ncbi:MAG: putative 3-phosphoinositide-dependent protein kinase, partial [Streblomastix strix]
MNNISQFEEKEVIGVGSFSRVFRAIFKQDQKEYAIRQLAKIQLIKQKLEKTVFLERDFLYKFPHRFIIKLFGNFQDRDFLYFVLELCLFDFQKLSNKKLPIELVRYYSAEIVEAVEYIHSIGDLKPENILIGQDGHVRISDFGSAIFINSTEYQE